MKNIILILSVLIMLSSCHKPTALPSLDIYTERSPVSGRTQLEFLSGNMVIKSEPGYPYRDTFTCQVSGGNIKLTPTWPYQTLATNLGFWVIDDNTLKIDNLYASIPEDPKVYMIFKK